MPAWPVDRLVFLNDVFFCAGDLFRLLQHVDADVACGMDFMAWKDPPSTNDIRLFGPHGPPLSVHNLAFVRCRSVCWLSHAQTSLYMWPLDASSYRSGSISALNSCTSGVNRIIYCTGGARSATAAVL